MIETPAAGDILCGKDKTYGKHSGNVKYREMIQAKAPDYALAKSKQAKMRLTTEIVSELMTKYGSRFLKVSADHQGWEELSAAAARDKTSHALRFCAQHTPGLIPSTTKSATVPPTLLPRPMPNAIPPSSASSSNFHPMQQQQLMPSPYIAVAPSAADAAAGLGGGERPFLLPSAPSDPIPRSISPPMNAISDVLNGKRPSSPPPPPQEYAEESSITQSRSEPAPKRRLLVDHTQGNVLIAPKPTSVSNALDLLALAAESQCENNSTTSTTMSTMTTTMAPPIPAIRPYLSATSNSIAPTAAAKPPHPQPVSREVSGSTMTCLIDHINDEMKIEMV